MPSANYSLLAALLAVSLIAQAQTVYRWTDKDGKVNYADLPPPADVKDLQQQKLGSANRIDSSGPSYSMQKAAREFPVTLYTSVDCAMECKIARDFLSRRGIAFSEKIIKTPDDATALKNATGDNELAIPTLLIGGRAEKGYLEHAWNKLLDAAGYPGADATTP